MNWPSVNSRRMVPFPTSSSGCAKLSTCRYTLRSKLQIPAMLLWWLLAVAPPAAEPASILAPLWFQPRSHFVVYEPLLKALAARGHNLTVLSHFPQRTPIHNYHDVIIAGTAPQFTNKIPVDMILSIRSPVDLSLVMWRNLTEHCRQVYDLPQVRRLLQAGQHYDLVIVEVFFVDCLVALAHHFRAPLVGIVSSMALPWALDWVGNPEHPAYSQTYFSRSAPPFGFWQRLRQSVDHLAARLGYWLWSDLAVDAVVRGALGEGVPATADLRRRSSLLLVNHHWSLGAPQPTVPAVVHIAGIHLQPPQPLPQDVQEFLDGSVEGAVLFSLGSMTRSETLAADKMAALVSAFSALPQRVLWKGDPALLPPLPSNVMATPWLPQNDVLHHPNVRVFVTHAGMLSVLEATNAGVPMLAIPLFGDQPSNAAMTVATGNALALVFEDLDEHSLRDALGELLNNERYRERAKQQSVLFRDRPRPPLEEAVYWVEYVIRHRGAPHLRSAALDLAWYQYLLIDVAAFVLAVAATLLLATYWLLRTIKALFTSESTDGRKVKTS